ncbi:MAG: EAL domain-containing protein, partial [Comamonas sp.]|nr:EAL domain-containing protein [Comamonas sp.]
PPVPATALLRHTLLQQTHQLRDDALCLHIAGSHGSALLLWLQVAPLAGGLARGLLQVFASHAALALENLQLYLSINDLAFTDPLVRLPNRNAMVVALERRQWPDGTLALLDLDGFSDINSVLDEHFGDTVLCAVAHRLVTELSAHALVARVGGDLFGIYGRADRVTAENLARIFAQPFVINDGEPLRLAATAGLVQMSNTSISGVVALKHAGVALKQAKSRARGKSMYFEPTQIDAASDRMHMLNRLRAAFSEERLFLHYQPLVHLGTGRVVGAECLLRWRRSDGRMVPPDIFIPLAEQSGLMIALGQWVVRTALLWRRSLRGVVDEDFRVAINVSHAQFAEPNFVDVFLLLLCELQVPGAQVEIELTESVAVGNVQQLVAKLTQLRAAGVRVAMDDFGTGYSSLSIIQRLALDKLKIDRSFISGAQAQNNTFEIARTIITLAEHLQLATTAEGIETQEQCEALLAVGCELGQGYWFSRPLAEADFPQWLHHYSTSQSQGESNG